MKVKVKITYTSEQEPQALAALAVLRQQFPTARVHETDKNDRIKALYLTSSTPAGSSETTLPQNDPQGVLV